MVVYSDRFGSGVIQPSPTQYQAYTSSVNLTLVWALEAAPNDNVVAQVMDVSMTATGLTITMPDAMETSNGINAVFNNVGANPFTVLDSAGGTIVTATAGAAWLVYLANNTTASGTFRTFQMGAGTSAASAAALAGYGIEALGQTLNQKYNVVSYATNPTFATANRAEFAVWTGGAGVAAFAPVATLTNGWFANIRNEGTGALELTPTGGSLINTATSFTLNPTDSLIIVCDGTAFYTFGYGQDAVFAFDYTAIDVAGQSGTYTLSGNELNRIAYKFTGALAGALDIIVPSTKQQYWITNGTATTAPFQFGVRTVTQASPGITIAQNAADILYCNGTDVVDADTQGISVPLSISMGGTSATSAAGARTNLDVPSNSDAILYAIVFGGGYTG